MQIANDLLSLYQEQPSLFRARQTLKQDLPHLFDKEDILAQTEQILMPPIDLLVTHRVHQAAKRVAVVTALSPRALFDIVVVLVETVRMVRFIAESYGNRPGFVAMLRLTGHIASHLARHRRYGSWRNSAATDRGTWSRSSPLGQARRRIVKRHPDRPYWPYDHRSLPPNALQDRTPTAIGGRDQNTSGNL